MDFATRLSLFGERAAEIQNAVENSPYRKEMEFLYSTMPISDAANYPCKCFEAYAAHAHFLRENAAWCCELPEELYLHYVLYHRINNEDITDCRTIFYDRLWNQIEGKPMEEAIKIINYWCLEEATYRLTDDRTVSPLTVLRCAFGRCGEESTFTVTALRSVGIPARQVYSPKWAHCDDNHAWVEVWCDGAWHYLGACEPEEILDRGWFTAASSRAMMIHSRTFQGDCAADEYIAQEGCMKLWNQLPRYADTAVLTIRVHENGKPCAGVLVKAELLNYAQFSPIAVMMTDEEGMLSFTTGLGDLHLHLVKDGRFLTRKVDLRKEQSVDFDFAQAKTAEADDRVGMDFEMHPPKDNMRFMTAQTEETKQLRQKKFDEAVAARHSKEQKFLKEEQAREELLQAGFSKEEAERAAALCANAYGNAQTVLTFLKGKDNRESRIDLLQSLTAKDLTDCEAPILEEALKFAMQWKDKMPKELFVPYVLCPRVGLEKLSLYREALPAKFSAVQWEDFRRDPHTIGTWIAEQITHHPQQEYEGLITLPLALLAVRSGSLTSQKILFAAICRTLGIPARLAPDDGRVQFWDEAKGAFADGMPEEDNEARYPFVITSKEKEPWVYTQNWTISRLEDGNYVTLDFQDIPWETQGETQRITLELRKGQYRLITCKRMPTGSLFAKEYRFSAGEGKENTLEIAQRTARLSDLLEDREIPDFDLHREDGTPAAISTLTKDRPTLLMWLQEGEEPTQHILNELYDLRQEFSTLPLRILFLVKHKDALMEKHIRRALEAQPEIEVLYDDFRDNRSALARRMYVDPDKLPMLVLTNRERNGIYAFSGYNVGMGDLLLKIIRESYEG